jgi:hypothetical protein
MMQKLPQHLLKNLFHYHPVENWMNGELQGTIFGQSLNPPRKPNYHHPLAKQLLDL